MPLINMPIKKIKKLDKYANDISLLILSYRISELKRQLQGIQNELDQLQDPLELQVQSVDHVTTRIRRIN